MFQLSQQSKYALHLPFYSVETLNGWDDAHHTGEGASLLSLLMQMLISPRNMLTGTARVTFYQLSGHRLALADIKRTITVGKVTHSYSLGL